MQDAIHMQAYNINLKLVLVQLEQNRKMNNKKQMYSCNRLWRTVWLWDAQAATLYRAVVFNLFFLFMYPQM
jgi:hypothetical protein